MQVAENKRCLGFVENDRIKGKTQIQFNYISNGITVYFVKGAKTNEVFDSKLWTPYKKGEALIIDEKSSFAYIAVNSNKEFAQVIVSYK